MDDELTREEAERAGELITHLLSALAIQRALMTDEELDLIERGLERMRAHLSKQEAMSVVHMAMGVDILHEPVFRRQQRNLPLARDFVKLLRRVEENAYAEIEDEEAQARRDEWRRSLLGG